MNILECDLKELENVLIEAKILDPNESLLSREKAGQGNMNLTLRLSTSSERTLIVKQAFPYCYKYPSIPAPLERLAVEAEYYQEVAQDEGLRSYGPQFLGADLDLQLIALEDLGDASDMSTLYGDEQLTQDELQELCAYLRRLHKLPNREKSLLYNDQMRRLNHEYIFDLPLRADNGIELDQVTPGLQALGDTLKGDSSFCSQVTELGSQYLSSRGPSLLHGDYYPASWLRTSSGIKVIDSEFCFYGPPEFDYSVLLAHLILSDHTPELLGALRDSAKTAGDWQLICQYAGVEVMRRILSVSMIRPEESLEWKERMLQSARKLVLERSIDMQTL